MADTQMRSRAEVRDRLRQAMYRHYARAAKVFLSRRAEACAHRIIMEGPNGPVSLCGRQSATLCAPGAPWDKSSECGDLFEARWDQKALRSLFKGEMDQPLPELMRDYPDVATLRWVLQGAPIPKAVAPVEEEPVEPPPVSGADEWGSSEEDPGLADAPVKGSDGLFQWIRRLW